MPLEQSFWSCVAGAYLSTIKYTFMHLYDTKNWKKFYTLSLFLQRILARFSVSTQGLIARGLSLCYLYFILPIIWKLPFLGILSIPYAQTTYTLVCFYILQTFFQSCVDTRYGWSVAREGLWVKACICRAYPTLSWRSLVIWERQETGPSLE